MRPAHPFGGTDRVIPERGMPGLWSDRTFSLGLLCCGPVLEKEKARQ
jgi:hypothetical protein